MAKPPGSCPHAEHPWNCPAVKALQDAVDSCEDAWRQINKLELQYMADGRPKMFPSCYNRTKELASSNLTVIENNQVEPRS